MSRSIGREFASPAIAAIVVAWFSFCWHWLSGADVIPFDSKLTYFQLTSWAVDCYRQGFLPLWDPYFMSGFPACADPQIHCFYLFAMPFFALLGPLHPTWFDRVELLHILAAGMGIYFLAREFRLTPASALVTALVVMFGGSASARLQHTGMIYAYGLLPWCLLLTKFVFARSSWWYVVALGICAGSLGILGDQVAFLSCLLVAAFAAALIIKSGLERRSFVMPLVRLVVAGGFTVLVMLPQMVPTAELLPLSSRPWIPLQNLRPKSLYEWSFLTYLVPNLFRTFDGYVNYIGKNDPTETYLYIGLLPATILLYGGIFKRLFFRRKNLWFVLPLTFFILYALGTQTPAYAAFWYLIPGVKSFQRPTDATFLINIFVALVIGRMLDELRRRSDSSDSADSKSRSDPGSVSVSVSVPPISTAFAIASAFTAVILISTILICKYKVPNVHLHLNNLAFLKLGLFAFGGVLVLQLLERVRERGVQNILITVVAVVSFVDLQFANSRTFLNSAVSGDYAYDAPEKLNQFPALRILAKLKSSAIDPYRVETLGSEKENQWWNTGNHLQVQATDGMWPINLLSYHQYNGACNPLFGRKFNHWMSGFDSSLFDLLNVEYVLTNFPSTKAHSVLKPAKFAPTISDNQYTVYRNLKVLPRSFLLAKYKLCGNFTDLSDVIRHENFSPKSEVVFLADDFSGNPNALKAIDQSSHQLSMRDTVTWIEYGQNQLDLSVHAAEDRVLFLGDIYFPGWTATIDGAQTKTYRADYLFRAIIVPAGDHVVRFRYNPYSIDALKEASRLAQTR